MPAQSEYERHYQWDRTWLNAGHPREVPQMNFSQTKPRPSLKPMLPPKAATKPAVTMKESQPDKTQIDLNQAEHNKKIQTKYSDKFIEEEIRKIREDLMKKKEKLVKKISSTVDTKPSVVPKKPENLPAKEPSVSVKRPKTAPSKPKKEKNEQPPVVASTKDSKPMTVALPKPKKNMSKWEHYPQAFVTEYRNQFKPIMYCSAENLSNLRPSTDRVFVIGEKRRVRPSSTSPRRHKGQGPIPNARGHYETTYDHTFGQKSKSVHDINRPQTAVPVNELRQKAEYYKLRTNSSHFSRNHLVQLESQEVALWNPTYETDRARPDKTSRAVSPIMMKPAGVSTPVMPTCFGDSTRMKENVFCWDDDSSSRASYRNKKTRNSLTYTISQPAAGKATYDSHAIMDNNVQYSYDCSAGSTCDIGSITSRSSIISSVSMAEDTLKRAKDQQKRMEMYRSTFGPRRLPEGQTRESTPRMAALD